MVPGICLFMQLEFDILSWPDLVRVKTLHPWWASTKESQDIDNDRWLHPWKVPACQSSPTKPLNDDYQAKSIKPPTASCWICWTILGYESPIEPPAFWGGCYWPRPGFMARGPSTSLVLDLVFFRAGFAVVSCGQRDELGRKMQRDPMAGYWIT